MKRRISIFIMSLVLSICMISNSAIPVYASDTGSGRHDVSGFNDWTTYEKFLFWRDNLISMIGGATGCILNPNNWNYEHYMEYLQSVALDMQIADFSSNYQEYVANRLGLNESGEIVVENELVDLMYLTTVEYIEQETGFYTLKTIPFAEIPATKFSMESEYNSWLSYLRSLPSDSVVYVNMHYTTALKESHGTDGSGAVAIFYEFDNTVSFVQAKAMTDYLGFNAYKDWLLVEEPANFYNISTHNVTEYLNSKISLLGINHYLPTSSMYRDMGLFTLNGSEIRIYKTIDDMKNYSVGQRPYFLTDKFQDYDINGDNSCILSESDLQNSSIYGDVINYIINNYGDGLTEDELRKIIEELLEDLQNDDDDDGGGSGSGDDDGGGGLGGLLDGLGSLGDAILGIVGKLIEVVGNILELITNSLLDIITIIPDSISELLVKVFPFIPEEWVTAITLSFVLGIIVGLVRLFK